ncbi:endonuclease domain-containing protein [Angustibacter aerolatus]
MPTAHDVPPELLERPFTVAEAAALGVSRQVLRGRRFRAPHRGVRVVADLPDSLLLRCRAAALALPPDAAFSHHTGARLRGWPVPGRWSDGVDVVSHRRAPQLEGIRVEHSPWLHGDVQLVEGLRVLVPAWLWLSLAERLPLDDLVVAADAAWRLGDLSREGLRPPVGVAVGRRWVTRARQALDLMEPGVDSPMETRLRLLVLRSGLPRPTVHAPVTVLSGQVLHPDLVFERHLTVVEYEGDHHRTDRSQWQHDLWRYAALEAAGWTVVRFTADDVLRHPQRAVSHLRGVLARRPSHAEMRAVVAQTDVWSTTTRISATEG